MSEWIMIRQYLPIDYRNVDVYETKTVIITDGAHVCCGEFQAGRNWSGFSNYMDIPAAAVTHWMPLPEPPK